MIPDSMVQQMLLETGKIKEEQAKELLEQVKQVKRPLQDIVVKNNIISEKDLTQLYAKEIEVPFIEIETKEIDKDILKLVPERVARKYNVALIGAKKDGSHILAMEDPDDVQALDFLKKILGKKLEVHIAPKQDILSALDQYRGNISSEITKVVTEDDEEEGEEIDESDLAEDSPIAQTVNLLIEYAVKSEASDIHIEPRDKFVQIRYRIDGVLKEANQLPRKILASLVSRIKILSNLKIDERRVPQDGRFKINLNGRIFAFRVSTLPVVDGEKVVLRVLDESSDALSLEKLGFWGKSLDVVNNAIVQPHGMILVTGPTGSGKSTTLHSVLNILNRPNINISTIEDPVEYKLEGTNQTQVNPKAGMTFANGLRALLRQDPNVIMVGEIRDQETAGLAVQAALTGHLVFSTLHTNNAATCLPRLLEMGIEPFLIASTVRAVVGQRLVRKINPEGCEQYQLTEAEKSQIENIFNIKSKQDWTKVYTLANQYREAMGEKKSDTFTLWRPKKGDNTKTPGYKGRMGIYEVLGVSSAVQQLIVGNATSSQIQDQAVKDGMNVMQLDGLIKALVGLTSIEEILRVTRE